MEQISIKTFKFVFPFVLAAIYISLLFVILPFDQFKTMLAAMGGYFFPPLGKESVIPFAIANYIPWHIAAVSIAMVDVILAIFVLWNYELVLRIPFMGPKLKALADRGTAALKKKEWLEKLSYFAIILFVMVPFEGSGGLIGSVIGRMLGLDKRKVFVSVVVGAFSGCFLIAKFSSTILEIFTPDIRIVGGVIALVIIISIVIWLMRSRKSE